MNSILKSPSKLLERVLLAGVLEFGPVLIFIFAFGRYQIYRATIFLMVATIISTLMTFGIQKRLPYLALYMALLTGVFGYVTLSLHQPRFIQMRDTLYDVTCAVTLIVGLMINVSFLKLAFHKVIPMSMNAWEKLTYAWIGYFVSAAVLNEYVRKTMTLEEWFSYKSIIIVVTIIFGILSLYFTYEHDHEGSIV